MATQADSLLNCEIFAQFLSVLEESSWCSDRKPKIPNKMSTFKFDSFQAQSFLTNCDSVVQELFKISTTKNARFEEMRNGLKTTLYPTFGNVTVRFYGSRVIGVGTLQSDLDIFVDIGGKFNSDYEFTPLDEENFIKMEAALNSSPDWKVEGCVKKSYVPIINATYTAMRLKCKLLKNQKFHNLTLKITNRRHLDV
jgi:predicted nucleotidyltransferase